MQKLVALACVMWLLPLASHAEQLSFRLKRGGDNALCRDYFAQVNGIKPSYAQFSCGLTVATAGSRFSLPQWQELKIDENLDLIYLVEQQMTPTPLPPIAEWKKQYVQEEQEQKRIRTGYGKVVTLNFHPRMRETKARFWNGGPVFTLMAYTADREAESYCAALLAQCPPPIEFSKEEIAQSQECGHKFEDEHKVSGSSQGEHIFLYERTTGAPTFIGWTDSHVGGSGSTYDLFLYDGVAFMAGTGAGSNGIERVEQVVVGGRAIPGLFVVRSVCEMGAVRGKDGTKDGSK